MPSEGPQQAGERNRLKRNSMTFNKRKCEVLHLGWNNLCRLGATRQKAAFQKKICGQQVSGVPLQQGMPTTH